MRLTVVGVKLCTQNRTLLPLRGSFQNFQRAPLSLLYESPPGLSVVVTGSGGPLYFTVMRMRYFVKL